MKRANVDKITKLLGALFGLSLNAGKMDQFLLESLDKKLNIRLQPISMV